MRHALQCTLLRRLTPIVLLLLLRYPAQGQGSVFDVVIDVSLLKL
jgi:hypothetical protein